MKTYKLNLFFCDIPDGYELDENEEVLSIYNGQAGVGALQISSYKIPDDYIFKREEEFIEFIKSNDNNLRSEKIKSEILSTEKSLSYQTDDNEQSWWKYWLIFKNGIALFITYNCIVEDKKIEVEKINEIVNSIKVKKK